LDAKRHVKPSGPVRGRGKESEKNVSRGFKGGGKTWGEKKRTVRKRGADPRAAAPSDPQKKSSPEGGKKEGREPRAWVMNADDGLVYHTSPSLGGEKRVEKKNPEEKGGGSTRNDQ